jgi:predicted DNA-binding antitoxin AbrB/MazE fold protein
MDTQITVIYEKGILRPLQPLSLPEHTRLEIQMSIPSKGNSSIEKQAEQALISAGVVEYTPTIAFPDNISEKELETAAKIMGAAGPLSDIILAERDGR